jgi:hypothetical protein
MAFRQQSRNGSETACCGQEKNSLWSHLPSAMRVALAKPKLISAQCRLYKGPEEGSCRDTEAETRYHKTLRYLYYLTPILSMNQHGLTASIRVVSKHTTSSSLQVQSPAPVSCVMFCPRLFPITDIAKVPPARSAALQLAQLVKRRRALRLGKSFSIPSRDSHHSTMLKGKGKGWQRIGCNMLSVPHHATSLGGIPCDCFPEQLSILKKPSSFKWFLQ